jgi:hypothetical protein
MNPADVKDTMVSVGKLTRRADDTDTRLSQLTYELGGKSPVSHTHEFNDVNGLIDTLSNKANKAHTHALEEIPAIGRALDEKSNVTHTHSLMSLADFNNQIAPQDGGFLRYSAADNSWTASRAAGYVEHKESIFYILTPSDSGLIIDHEQESNSIVGLPNDAPVGFCIELIQSGNGRIDFQPQPGATIFNKHGHTKTASKWSWVKLVVRKNSTGASAVYVLTGDTAE